MLHCGEIFITNWGKYFKVWWQLYFKAGNHKAKKTLLFSEMRVTKKIFTWAAEKKNFYFDFLRTGKFLRRKNIFQGPKNILEEQGKFNLVRKDLMN